MYAILSSTISFYLPCLAMLCIYYRLYRYARKQVETIRMTYKTSIGGHSQAVHEERDDTSSSLRDKMSDHKAAITLGVIMGVFLMSWSPFFTVNLVGALCGPGCVPPLVFAVFTWLGYVNSTMNPIIYSIFNREFRDAFRRVLAAARRRLSCRDHAGPLSADAKYGAVRTNATASVAQGEFLATLEDISAPRTRSSLNSPVPLKQIYTSI